MATAEQPKLRYTYIHVDGCKSSTWIGRDLASRLSDTTEDQETLYCSGCRAGLPIEQFAWVGPDGHASGERVCPPKS